MKFHRTPEKWRVVVLSRDWRLAGDNLDMSDPDEILPGTFTQRWEWLELWETIDTVSGSSIDYALALFRYRNPGALNPVMLHVEPVYRKPPPDRKRTQGNRKRRANA